MKIDPHKQLQWIAVLTSTPSLMPERPLVNVRQVAEDHVNWVRFTVACAAKIGGAK